MPEKTKRILRKGIIVSIQGYSQSTTQELAINAESAGAVAIRTDKPIKTEIPIIGLAKIKVINRKTTPYITCTTELINKISEWADYVAVDYRALNKNLKILSEYCVTHAIKVIADIGRIDDFMNIRENGYYYDFIATTFSVYNKTLYPDKKLVKKLLREEKNVIGEGNYMYRNDVEEVLKMGAHNICIGGAISDIYKLTRKYVTILC